MVQRRGGRREAKKKKSGALSILLHTLAGNTATLRQRSSRAHSQLPPETLPKGRSRHSPESKNHAIHGPTTLLLCSSPSPSQWQGYSPAMAKQLRRHLGRSRRACESPPSTTGGSGPRCVLGKKTLDRYPGPLSRRNKHSAAAKRHHWTLSPFPPKSGETPSTAKRSPPPPRHHLPPPKSARSLESK